MFEFKLDSVDYYLKTQPTRKFFYIPSYIKWLSQDFSCIFVQGLCWYCERVLCKTCGVSSHDDQTQPRWNSQWSSWWLNFLNDTQLFLIWSMQSVLLCVQNPRSLPYVLYPSVNLCMCVLRCVLELLFKLTQLLLLLFNFSYLPYNWKISNTQILIL